MVEIWKALFTLPSSDIEGVEPSLWDAFETLSIYRDEDNQTQHSVEVTYQGAQNQENIEQKIVKICADAAISIPKISFEKIPDINWLEHVYELRVPIEAGRFFIHGGHITDYPDDKIEISVNAATAFGTGEHATTKGCLLALDHLLETENFQNPIDMGCGSGVLSFALAKALQCSVTAIDNDEEAVRVTIKNAEINDVSSSISVACGNGFDTPLAQENAPYDLIMANILAGPLVDMSENLAKSCDRNGFVILSGVLQTQEAWVISTYEKLGFSVIDTYPIDEWQTCVLRKNDK